MKTLAFSGLGLTLVVALVMVGFVIADAQPGSTDDPLVAQSYVDQLAKYRIVVVPSGERLEAADDGVEVMLRSGNATIVASPAGGVANLTAGRDMGQGEKVPANNLLLIPRADGRGLHALSEAIVMVRGAYVLK